MKAPSSRPARARRAHTPSPSRPPRARAPTPTPHHPAQRVSPRSCRLVRSALGTQHRARRRTTAGAGGGRRPFAGVASAGEAGAGARVRGRRAWRRGGGRGLRLRRRRRERRLRVRKRGRHTGASRSCRLLCASTILLTLSLRTDEAFQELVDAARFFSDLSPRNSLRAPYSSLPSSYETARPRTTTTTTTASSWAPATTASATSTPPFYSDEDPALASESPPVLEGLSSGAEGEGDDRSPPLPGALPVDEKRGIREGEKGGPAPARAADGAAAPAKERQGWFSWLRALGATVEVKVWHLVGLCGVLIGVGIGARCVPSSRASSPLLLSLTLTRRSHQLPRPHPRSRIVARRAPRLCAPRVALPGAVDPGGRRAVRRPPRLVADASGRGHVEPVSVTPLSLSY